MFINTKYPTAVNKDTDYVAHKKLEAKEIYDTLILDRRFSKNFQNNASFMGAANNVLETMYKEVTASPSRSSQKMKRATSNKHCTFHYYGGSATARFSDSFSWAPLDAFLETIKPQVNTSCGASRHNYEGACIVLCGEQMQPFMVHFP